MMKPSQMALAVPLVALGIPAIYLGGVGWSDFWSESSPALLLWPALVGFSAGWHAAWLVPAGRRSSPVLVSVAWLVSVVVCREGLNTSGFAGATALWSLLLEGTLLGLALQCAPRTPWAERLARWRRGRDDIATQVQMASGLIPWARSSGHRLLFGRQTGPATHGFEHFAAAVVDLDSRLGSRVSDVLLPEQARERLLTSARQIGAQAELASIEIGLALEQQVLSEAVAFRDLCARLPGMTEDERDTVARGGQAFLLGLVTNAYSNSNYSARRQLGLIYDASRR